MRPTITMTFTSDGKSSFEVNGTKGKSCTDLTGFLEKAFGAQDRKLKAEYYQQGSVQIGTISNGSPL